MKLIQDVYPASAFKKDGTELTADEYENLVKEKLQDQIVQNEIHRLLNYYAEKLVKTVSTLEEVAFARGAIDGLQALLKLKDGEQQRVTVRS